MSIEEGIAISFAPLQHADIPRVHALEKAAYPNPWTQGMFEQEVTGKASYFTVVRVGEEIIGYGGFWRLYDEAHVTKITVDTAWQRRGIATKILWHLIGVAQERNAVYMRLEVRESNRAAQALYEKEGFVTDGRRPRYYRVGNEDAVLMTKSFPGALQKGNIDS